MARTFDEGSDPNATTVRHVIKAVVWGVVAIIAIVLFFNSFYTVNPGERAIVMTWGDPSNTIYSEGLHLKVPMIQEVYKWDIKTQTLNFDSKTGIGDNSEYSSMFAASKDLQNVQIAVVVNYHIDGSKAVYMFKTYGTQEYYNKNIIEPIIREAVKSTSAKYTAEALVTQREQFQTDVQTLLEAKMTEKDAILERSNIVNFQFSESFSQAIEAKVTAEQNALAAQNKLEQVKFEAQQSVEKAKGEAQAIQVINDQLTKSPTYIEYLATTKWNGQLPYATNGVPFLNLPTYGAQISGTGQTVGQTLTNSTR